MYHETLWIAVSAVAPVIALAVVVAYNDMRSDETLHRRQMCKLGDFPIWRYVDPPGGPRAAQSVRRWNWTASGSHLVNLLAQATVLAFSLSSLAQHVDEIPLALPISAEVAGLLAILAASVASRRMTELLFQIAVYISEHQGDEPDHDDPGELDYDPAKPNHRPAEPDAAQPN